MFGNEQAASPNNRTSHIGENSHAFLIAPVVQNQFERIGVGWRHFAEHVYRRYSGTDRQAKLRDPKPVSLNNNLGHAGGVFEGGFSAIGMALDRSAICLIQADGLPEAPPPGRTEAPVLQFEFRLFVICRTSSILSNGHVAPVAAVRGAGNHARFATFKEREKRLGPCGRQLGECRTLTSRSAPRRLPPPGIERP